MIQNRNRLILFVKRSRHLLLKSMKSGDHILQSKKCRCLHFFDCRMWWPREAPPAIECAKPSPFPEIGIECAEPSTPHTIINAEQQPPPSSAIFLSSAARNIGSSACGPQPYEDDMPFSSMVRGLKRKFSSLAVKDSDKQINSTDGTTGERMEAKHRISHKRKTDDAHQGLWNH